MTKFFIFDTDNVIGSQPTVTEFISETLAEAAYSLPVPKGMVRVMNVKPDNDTSQYPWKRSDDNDTTDEWRADVKANSFDCKKVLEDRQKQWHNEPVELERAKLISKYMSANNTDKFNLGRKDQGLPEVPTKPKKGGKP